MKKHKKNIPALIIGARILYHNEILITQYPLHEKLKNGIGLKTVFLSAKRKDIGTSEAILLLLATDKGFNEKGTTQIFKKIELSR